jgi:cold shock protein
VEVVGGWDDEPTIELHVAADEPRLAEVENVPPVEASTRDGLFSVLLFVRDGMLDIIELVDNTGGGMPNELPAPSELADPMPLGPTAWRDATKPATVRGTVKHWNEDEGWGVLASHDVTGDVWAHFSHIEGQPGVGSLDAGAAVEFAFITPPGGQDGYAYRAVWVRQLDGKDASP